MANNNSEPTGSPQLPGTEGKAPTAESVIGGKGEVREGKDSEDASKAVVANNAEKTTSTASTIPKASTSSVRPSLVQLGSSSMHHPSSAQPKRFSAVNINKKFLEKNSSASASSPASQPAIKAGVGSSLARPQTQPTVTPSRLVTAKLTSTSPGSSTSGAGWSRSSSVAPQNATGTHSPNNSSPPLPTTSLGTNTSTTGAPQLPHGGKVIQPQPRTASTLPGISQKDSSGLAKPVWRNVKSTTVAQRPDVRNDFPTAAEVAQGASSLRTAKPNDVRETVESVTTSKPAGMEEADAFRGVHLDPNTHHWDEMEEDDDNFLDSVIEFGDGRQYKIEANNTASSLATVDSSLQSDAGRIGMSRLDDTAPSNDAASNLPVSKEERFADDFDRSWPRTSPANSRDVPLPSSRSGTSHLPPSPQESPAQQESARVLFNERSNRLEPYSNDQRSGQYTSRKSSWSSSPAEPQNTQEFLSTPHSANIQLLQKSGDTESRRRFSNTSTSGSFGPGSSNVHNRDRDLARRDGPVISPRLPKDSFGLSGRDRESPNERGRRSEMVPPPLPAHAMRRPSRDGGRQLPPHLSQAPVNATIRQDGRLSLSREPRFPPQGETSVQSARLPSQSPALSHASASRISPTVPLTPLPQLTAHDIDEARKDVMQSAAARAKQRRQQEEEEREKEKERARRKAAELEERIKAAEAEKTAIQEKLEAAKVTQQQQEEAIAIIEEAIKGVHPLPEPVDSCTPISSTQKPPSPGAQRSSEAAAVKVHSEQISNSASRNLSLQTSTIFPAVQADSWRTKATPQLPSSTLQPKPPPPSFITPIQVESLVDGAEDDLEVIDFMDMDKFVGVSSADANTRSGDTNGPKSTSRLVASDFFDEISRTEPQSPPKVPKITKSEELRPEASICDYSTPDSFQLSDSASVTVRASSSSTDHSATILPPQTSTRIARNQPFYKEAAMSALDDAMSRIKGALDGMQAGEGLKDTAPSALADMNKSQIAFGVRSNIQKERWVPPALRPRHLDSEREVLFLSTSSEPPQSPKLIRNAFIVKLPSVSPSSLESISKKQLQAAMRPSPLRMDILSFDPPVQGMNKRDFSINDVLFHKPTSGYRAKYRVNLPRSRPALRTSITPQHLPFKAGSVGAFGRPSEADGMTSWRKPVQPKQEDVNSVIKNGLTTSPATTSSSPVVTPIPVSETPAPTKSDAPALVRLRVPKMPAGSAVAIYRDSRIDAVDVDPRASVNFIVGSELEPQQAPQTTTLNSQLDVAVTPPIPPASSSESMHNVNELQINGINEAIGLVSSLVSPSKSHGQGSVDSVDPVPVTPQVTHHAASPWPRTSLPVPVKDSPARGPDPEHLRAVWSQTSNKAGIHGVNSLEGIGDDLTALPFTLQDVKSEDGETPPPSVSAQSSRMSIHDVTKAFQQVPESSSNPSSSGRTPPLTGPPARPPNYTYGLLPPPTNTIRPSYPYPPPIMSPSPSLMYPSMMPTSPVPGRIPMNGHTPLYGQPMWMPLPTGSAPQAHTMRPMASPYPAPMVPYSSGPPMYGPQPPANVQTQVQQGAPQLNRDRSIAMMSPVMPHAGPVMYGSPIMMPAHAAVAPNHTYLVPAGRGQTRVDNNGQIPQTPQQPHSPYNPPTFRPTW